MQNKHYNIDALANQFQKHGLVHLPQLVPTSICEHLVNTFHNDMKQEEHLIKMDRESYRKTGLIKHGVVNGLSVEKYFLPLNAIYFSLRPLVSLITGKEIICGKFPISDVNLVVYHKGSFKDPHFDSVPVTHLIFLTSHSSPSGDGALHYQSLDGTTHAVPAIAGNSVLFQGKKINHWVEELQADTTRIVVNANYYYTDDQERDPNFDNYYFKSPNQNK